MACLGRFVSQTRGGITRCNYSQSGAVLSHEKCSATPNSMSCGLKVYRSVRDAIAHLLFGRTSVTFILHGVMAIFCFCINFKSL